MLSAVENGLDVAAGPGGYAGKLRHFNHDTFTLSWPLVDFGTQHATFTIGADGKPKGFTTETLGCSGAWT